MRLIDADELKKCAIPCEIHNGALTELCVPLYQIDNAPTVEIPNYGGQVVPDMLQGWKYEERPQGEWIYNQYDANARIGNWHCSICHNICYEMKLAHDNFNFCPNCGAKMGNIK